jgi:hypothetical protein
VSSRPRRKQTEEGVQEGRKWAHGDDDQGTHVPSIADGTGLGWDGTVFALGAGREKELKGRHGGYQCRVTDRLH